MDEVRRHRHCDNRYFLPPLYCRVGITAEEGTLLHYTICGRQSVRAAAKAAPDVFVANKRRSWREGRPLLFCLSVNRSDDACYTHMHTHSMYLPPPAVSRTRIFRGIPGQRGTSERDREGRGTKAVAPPLPNFFLLSPLLHDYTYTSDGYSARAALLGALPDRPAATSRILPSLTHSHARSTHAMRHPSDRGRKEKTFRCCRHHRFNKSSLGASPPLSSLDLVHSSSHFLSAHHPGSVPRESFARIAITVSLSLTLSLSAFWLLASSPSCFHPLHFHSVAAALHSKESETYN